jgi:hypothetical protein
MDMMEDGCDGDAMDDGDVDEDDDVEVDVPTFGGKRANGFGNVDRVRTLSDASF